MDATQPQRPFAVLRVDRGRPRQWVPSLPRLLTTSGSDSPQRQPEGSGTIILHLSAGTTPYQATSQLLDDAECRNKDTVLCREAVLSASPGYFRSGREAIGGTFDPDKTKAWANGNGRINSPQRTPSGRANAPHPSASGASRCKTRGRL